MLILRALQGKYNSFHSVVVPLTAILMLSGSMWTSAEELMWSGAGETGSDPFGTAWLTQNNAFQGVTSWGIPGRGQGTSEFTSNASVKAILVSFFDLPSGVTILEDPRQTFQPTMNVTPFSSSDLWVWTSMSPTSGRFDPPTPDRTLDPLDSLLMYVTFTDEVDLGTFQFDVTYELVPIPEPGTMSLLIFTALLGVGRTRLLRSTSR